MDSGIIDELMNRVKQLEQENETLKKNLSAKEKSLNSTNNDKEEKKEEINLVYIPKQNNESSNESKFIIYYPIIHKKWTLTAEVEVKPTK